MLYRIDNKKNGIYDIKDFNKKILNICGEERTYDTKDSNRRY